MKYCRCKFPSDWLSTGTQHRTLATRTIPSLPRHRAQSQNFNILNSTNNSTRGFSKTSLRYRAHPTQNFSLRPTPAVQALSKGQTSLHTTATKEPTIHHIFESVTGTWQYIVADSSTQTAAIIDPVLNYDPVTQAITTDSADALLSLIEEKGYKIERILETHAHADHLTAASYLQRKLTRKQGYKPPIGIGKRIEQVQKLFGQRYGIQSEEYETVFDKLFEDEEFFQIGNVTAKAIHLPGHTPDHLGYQIGGTARCDFPGGDAKDLFQSSRKLLALDDHVKIWPGHDYPPEGRDSPIPWLSVADHRKQNKHVGDVVSEKEFVALRTERDAKLNAPRLLHQSLQVNIRAGQLPKPLDSGYRILRLPLKLNGLEW
ncbi:putative metallo-hydrolase [Penicillium verhagenii]|uniref:putative metallo-hydrolase n=1 Tax=Penicillium verhagenii TaxID=1562060 RepID=UPI0025450C5F|nr:putative metallo-hydrolase [Penicillium verhagenii]KAJ5928965.1 putative metallo-hydrolase [Penicillium verhagenii]